MRKFVQDNDRGDRPDRKPKREEVEVVGTAVALRDGESADSLIRRFRRVVESSGVLKELRQREAYLSPSEKRKEKGRRAAKRRAKEAKRLAEGGPRN